MNYFSLIGNLSFVFICSSEDIASIEINKYFSNDFKSDKNLSIHVGVFKNENKTNNQYQHFLV